MALGFDSYMNQERPQQNQFLTGNPATQPEAQTSWMNPSEWGAEAGKQMGAQQPAAQTATPPSNGTALGAVSAGNTAGVANYGQAPLGFDQAKWADPNTGNSLKYQVGRMAASGMPIDQIASKVGAKVIAPDKIQYPDGFIADIYFDYGGPNQRVQYLDQTPGQGLGQQQGFLGGQGQDQQGFMQYLMQLLGMGGGNNSAQPRIRPTTGLPNQQFNPTGGNAGIQAPTNPYPNTGVAGGYQGRGGGLQSGPLDSIGGSGFGDINRSYLGGTPTPNLDPITTLQQMWAGTYKDPRAGMPQ